MKLVKIAIVVCVVLLLASFLMPIVPHGHCLPGKALAVGMLNNLLVAIADYHRDNGVYPPDSGDGDLDKCSETLYFYLVGCDVDSPNKELRERLRRERMNAKVYFDFKKELLKDYDGDGRWEAVDAWGKPWLYVFTSPHPPFHRKTTYDLYSVGPDGKTGTAWKESRKMLKLSATDPASFYYQATDERVDGDSMAVKYPADDVANF